jgi:predicted Ser/Thr protein kinase
MIGKEIANYRILEKLGEGGMGVVYKAVDTSLDRVVALKALNAELARNSELEQRFRAEAKAQANLNHTNLATLYAFLIQDSTAWMVMEFIEGETFEHMVQRRGPIPHGESVPMFRQALLGIGYAHRMGIVHRDIKPANMMLNNHGIVKVMDFGIAKVMGNRGMTRTGTQMGTAFYMSPEQVTNKPVDIRSDIYSLGVTLYELLTANVPFQGDSEFHIMSAHVHTPPPLPTKFYPYIPKGVENAVLKALEKNPDDRFQTVEEFGQALERPDDYVAPAVAPVHPMARGTRFEGAGPVVAAGVAGGAVAAAAAAGAGTNPPVQGAGAGVLPSPSPKPIWTRPPMLLAGAGALAGVVLAAVMMWPTPKPINGGGGAGAVNGGGTSSGGTGAVIEIPSGGGGGQALDKGADQKAGADKGKSGGSDKGKSGGGQSASGEQKHKAAEGEKEATATRAAIVIPSGTPVEIRTINSIDSRTAQPGQRFDASLNAPLVAGGKVIAPRGANARLSLVSVGNAGKFKGRSVVQLQLTSLTIHGRAYPVRSDVFIKEGASRGKATGVAVGVGAAVGGAIGGIFGRNKKSAAGGAAAGAGGGAVYQAATNGEPVVIPSETPIHFVLRGAVSIPQG